MFEDVHKREKKCASESHSCGTRAVTSLQTQPRHCPSRRSQVHKATGIHNRFVTYSLHKEDPADFQMLNKS